MNRPPAKLALALGLLMALAVAGGCRADNPPADADAQRLQAAGLFGDTRSTAFKGKSADRSAQPILRIDVYHLKVPQGTVSGNETFWSRVDEHAVDVATYDLLFKNGVRVGTAPKSDWAFFRKLLDENPVDPESRSLIGTQAKDVDLEVHKDIETQNIFYLDDTNTLQGRSYDQCVNYLAASFRPAPRSDSSVRIALCPVVKVLRKRLEYTPTNKEMEITYTAPERIYDLNLVVDVALDTFLIVAPSNEATWPSSIGNSFFVHDGTAERYEDVLLFVPARNEAVEAAVER